MIAHIKSQRTNHAVPIATSLRALSLSRSWFYKHEGLKPTEACRRRERLDRDISTVFAAHDGTYGSPRIQAELAEREQWAGLSVNTVAARMVALELYAKPKRQRRSLTRADKDARAFPNLLKRDFSPEAPNVAFCGDITEVKTWEGALYLATVIDLYSRRLIGYAIACHCKATLVEDAMKAAIATRGGNVAGVVFHSDRGSQYTSGDFKKLCARHGITQSMSRSGSCLDNAVAEAFFASLKTEMVYRTALRDKATARVHLARWLERYNRVRRHSHCAYKAPAVYEEAMATVTSIRPGTDLGLAA